MLIDQAMACGARLSQCCKVLNLSRRTINRWRIDQQNNKEDKRKNALRAKPSNSLTSEQKDEIISYCNLPENASKPPAQIVPELADQGIYIASESSFYRVLRERKQLMHRGRARTPKKKIKATHTAKAPNKVWVWDITFLHSSVAGIYYKLYFIMDLYSRKIVAYETWTEENAEHSKALLQRASLSENIAISSKPLILHGDNGSPLKAGTVLATMQQLGITASHSRPRVSNDNAHAEALFRTAKYHPSLPPKGFESLDAARAWTQKFVNWYNTQHLHSSLKFVTPEQKHADEDVKILANRKTVYEQAKRENPLRWIGGKIRDWTPVTHTHLNPIDERKVERLHKKAA